MRDAVITNYSLLLYNYCLFIGMTLSRSCSFEGQLFESRQLEDIKIRDRTSICSMFKYQTEDNT